MKYRTLKVRKGRRDYTLKSKPYSGNPITPSFFSKVPGWNRPGLPSTLLYRYPLRKVDYRLFWKGAHRQPASAQTGAFRTRIDEHTVRNSNSIRQTFVKYNPLCKNNQNHHYRKVKLAIPGQELWQRQQSNF